MRIYAGYEITYECPQPTPILLMLSLHPSRLGDLLAPATMTIAPPLPVRHYHDIYGNACSRIAAPAGTFTVSSDFMINDSGAPDIVEPDAGQLPVEELPDDVLLYLLGSRYCDTDHLSEPGLVAVRQRPARLAPRAGHLRLRPRAPHVRLPARARPRGRPGTDSASSAACAATSRIWRSRCAAA